MTEGGNTTRVLIAVIITALVAVAAIAGIWYWQNQESGRLEERIGRVESEKMEEVNRLNERIQELEKEQTQTQTKTQEEKEPATNPPQQPSANLFISPKGVVIQVDSPEEGSKLTSPLTVSGMVPGNWSFEASFGVLLKDSSGKIIAQAPAQLEGDWMTEDMVPFSGTLSFTAPGTTSGFLILQKNNASGLPEHDDSIAIPVKF